MKYQDVEIGTGIYNRGDMANVEHFGVITDKKTDRFCSVAQIKPDQDHSKKSYWVPVSMIENIDNGSGRIVTLSAYREYRNNLLKKMGLI
jgi:hypothetical protein